MCETPKNYKSHCLSGSMRKGDVFFGGTLGFAALTIGYIAHQTFELIHCARTHPSELKVYEGLVVDRRYEKEHVTFTLDTSAGNRTFHILTRESLDSLISPGSRVRIEVPGERVTERELYISRESVRN